MTTTRTMYMHTLDGKPARFAATPHPYIHFVGGRNRGALVPTLAQIRREQAAAINDAEDDRYAQDWADPKRYGYVLVEVPNGDA